jgi:hypothetical protein
LDLHDSLERFISPGRTVEIHLVLRLVGRKEKRKTLNVIPVGVTDEDMDGKWSRPEFFKEAMAELTNSGTCIEDDDLSIRPEFHT